MAASTAVTVEEDTPERGTDAQRTAQVAALTGLRGFASLMVVVVHVSALTSYAWVGIPSYGPVSLFVLSGYLLYRPWARWGLQVASRPSTAVFVRRRLARIFPAYLLVFFVFAVIDPSARPTSSSEWFSMVSLTWIYHDDYLPTYFVQTWSLATELSWYVALPIMAAVTSGLARRASSRRSGFWITTAMLASSIPISVAWRFWVSNQTESSVPHGLWLPGFLACFAGGALIAHAAEGWRSGVVRLVWVRKVANDPWGLLVLALALALLGTSALGGPAGFPDTFAQDQLRIACATLIALTLLLAAALGSAQTPLNRVLGSRWCTAVGRWSYGIFLWHFPLLMMLEDAVDFRPGMLGFVTRLVVVLAISIPLSAATYAWIERPAIAWSHGGPSQRRERPRDESTDTAAPTHQVASTSAQATPPTTDQARKDPAGE